MGNVVTAQSSNLGYLVRSGIESFSVRKPKSKHEKMHPLGTNVGGCFDLFYETATAVLQHSKYSYAFLKCVV